MYIVGVVLIVASLCGLGHSDCNASVSLPSNGIDNGVEIGERVEVSCQCSVLELASWYFNGTALSSSMDSIPYVNLITGITVLVIPNFMPQHAGNYTCAPATSGILDQGLVIVIELNISKQLFMPPTNVHSEGITDDYSVNISWNNAITNSSVLDGYTVTLTQSPLIEFQQSFNISRAEMEYFEIVNGSNYEYFYTFHDIEPYSHNCLTVTAVYRHDNILLATRAAPTQCFNASSSEPTAPVDLRLVRLGYDFIIVSWNSPNSPNGPITNFTIYVNDRSFTIPVNGTQSHYAYMFNELRANSTYEISVSAVTDFTMEGPRSDSITVTTLIQDFVTLSIAIVYETLQDCDKIMDNKQAYKETSMMIYNKTIENIRQLCSCDIIIGLRFDTQLMCLPGNEKVIVFETRAYAPNETITLLEQSIQDVLLNASSSNIILVEGNTLTLMENGVCFERTTSNTTCYLPPSTDAGSKSDKDKTGLIIGVVSALLIVLLAITAAVILMVLCHKKRHSYHFTEKESKSQVTGVSAEFNRRSRPFSWSIPGFLLNTWRQSNNQTAPQLNHGKSNGEEPLGNDYSFPLPLPDKDATLKDSEIAGSKGITGILQGIDEEQPMFNEPENDESNQTKKTMGDDVKSGIKSEINFCLTPRTDGTKLTLVAKQKHANDKPILKPKENITTSYSIPVDYKWNNDKLIASNAIGADQKHMSPIYIEMDDMKCKDEESENDSHNDVYSVPIDSINKSNKFSVNDKHTGSPIRGKQAAKTTTSLPVGTEIAQSNCKPQSTGGNGSSLPNHNVDDDEYSVPIDDINSNTPGCESSNHGIYTSPINSPRMKNFSSPLNSPRIKKFNPRLEPSSPSNAKYSNPVATLSKQGNNKDSPFAAAVANIHSKKKQKCKPVKPNPYKSNSTSATLRNEDPPLYEEVLHTSATLPHNNGLHHNQFVPLDNAKMAASSQPVGLDDYTVPGTDKIALHKNPSYGDVCSTTEASEYTYVPTNRFRIPDMLQDVCTTYTEC